MTGVVAGQLYAVWAVTPCPRAALPGFPPFADSIGLGENGGFAEYMVANASELVPVVSLIQSNAIEPGGWDAEF